MKSLYSVLGFAHEKAVFNRRADTLARLLSEASHDGDSILDVGCGNGKIASLMRSRNGSLTFKGIDVVPRPSCAIPCELYDGHKIPFPDDSFDAVMLIDVLHHTNDPAVVLRECRRVVRNYILIKDHYSKSKMDRWKLTFMD